MSRSIGLERVVDFFREGNLDIAEITLMHVTNIVGQRRQKESASVASQQKRALPPARKVGRSKQQRPSLSMAVAGADTTAPAATVGETLADA